MDNKFPFGLGIGVKFESLRRSFLQEMAWQKRALCGFASCLEAMSFFVICFDEINRLSFLSQLANYNYWEAQFGLHQTTRIIKMVVLIRKSKEDTG